MSAHVERRLLLALVAVAGVVLAAVLVWLLVPGADSARFHGSSGENQRSVSGAHASPDGEAGEVGEASEDPLRIQEISARSLRGVVLRAADLQPVPGARVRATEFRPRQEAYELFAALDELGAQAQLAHVAVGYDPVLLISYF